MKRLDEILENREDSYILPFFWMKGEDDQTILEELERVQECGIRQLCLESRPHPDFCGEGWWRSLDLIMAEAKKRGMRVWVLDDKKFPTGYANGAFEKKYPELSKLYIAERHVDILGPCRSGASLIENFLEPDGRLLAILACPKPDSDTLSVSPKGVLDLTEQYRDGFVFYDLPEGAYRLFVFFTTRTGGGRADYMNLLDARSVRVLIDEVYEKHYERYGDEFGRTFAGFFSDEPELGNVPGYPFDCLPGQANIRLPWSDALEELLKKRWNGRFAENLPALWYEYGERAPAVRTEYMDCVTRLVYECFSGQIGKWCKSRGAEYIGHIIEDDNAHARLGCSVGHYFREMKGQHMAGIDVVHHQIVPGFTGKIHQWIAGDSDGEFFHFGLAKLAASAAHLDEEKKNRALCEIFGNYGWAEGVSLMKWLADHMLARGINRFTPHAFAMSYPDRDCPPHFYARGHNPQFEAFACLMKYVNRAAHLLSGEKPVREAAVLYHAKAEWGGMGAMYFQKPLRALMEAQMDADVVPDDLFDGAELSEGTLRLGSERYPALILPGCGRLAEKTARFIEENETDGFPIFAVEPLPEYDTAGRKLSEKFYERVTPVSLCSLADAVRETAGALLTADRSFPELRSFAVMQEKGLTLMLFNESTVKRAALTLRIDPRAGSFGSVTEADLWTNTAGSYRMEDNVLLVELEPGEAAFYLLGEAKEDLPSKPAKTGERAVNAQWQVSRRRNAESAFTPVRTLAPGQEFPNMNGPDGDPRFSGTYRYTCSFPFSIEEGASYRLLLPDAGDTARIFLNGEDLGYMAGFPGRAEATKALKDGENTLCIDVATTLVWERRDGASTHLQIRAAGLLKAPVLETYKQQCQGGKRE